MIKKQGIVMFLLCLLVVPNVAAASTISYGYFGTTSESSALWADGSNYDDYWTDVTVDGAGANNGSVIWLDDSGRFSESPSTANTSIPAPSGAKGFRLASGDGQEIYAVVAHSTNPNNTTVSFTKGSTTAGCDACEVFNCPGWGDYMQGLEDIKNAIPPAPDWQMVANTFRDTISPRIKSDLEDLFGYAPTPPPPPAAPQIPSRPSIPARPIEPELPSDLDDGGLTAPTGNENPSLEDSTFDFNDIRNSAPNITERQDPTGGGFEILDPVNGLPSQDAFRENLPNEGTVEFPSAPKEGTNIPPFPGDTTESPPTPNNDGGSAPIPNESGTAPIPGESIGGYPIPNQGNETVPLP